MKICPMFKYAPGSKSPKRCVRSFCICVQSIIWVQWLLKVRYLIFQTDFVRKLIAQFPGCGCRVGQQGFGVSVHECDGQHQGLFGFGSLKFQPTGWLIPGAVVESSFQPLLAVGGITGRSLSNQRLVLSLTEFYSFSHS